MEKNTKLLITKIIFAFGSVGLSIFLVFQVIGWMGDKFQENAKHVQEKAKADVAKAKQEADEREKFSSANLAKLKAQRQAEAEAQMQAARKLEIERFKKEVVENQAEENKKAEFEKQFKPRAECNDPMLEWSKVVQCKNDKITARENFYRTH